MGVDHTKKQEEGVREVNEEWEEVEEIDPRSLLSPLRVVPWIQEASANTLRCSPYEWLATKNEYKYTLLI